MNLEKLLSDLPQYRLLSRSDHSASGASIPIANITISNITADSRRVEPGTLFVAYRGISLDGHRFIPQAVAAGAAAIIYETGRQPPLPDDQKTGRPLFIGVPNGRQALAYLAAAWHGFPARRLTMIGITGTDGKTTTTNFLYQILHSGQRQASMISTVNAVIGDTVLETGLHTTTPDALDVQRYLTEMVRTGTDICLLETTSHGLIQHRVTACDFDIAIVTNITHEHLDLHGSLQAYRAAKAMLFESLAGAADKGLPKTAVLNCDDWSFGYLREKLAPLGVSWLGYSLAGHPQAAFTASRVRCKPDKTEFTIDGPGLTIEAETTLIGDFNISNCLAAVAAAAGVLDVPAAAVQRGIAALRGVPGRMERIDEGQPFVALVDFAHTPNSLRRTLTAARGLTTGRVIAVFGCAGARDVEKRTLMGHIAAELADLTIITAEDPRDESLAEIMATTAQAMVTRGGIEGQTFARVADRGRAILRAVQAARPGDIVLALGKGHEQSMCFGDIEYPWDDRQAMRSALHGKPLLTLPSAEWDSDKT